MTIKRREFLKNSIALTSGLLVPGVFTSCKSSSDEDIYDVLVYGGTSSGITAAIQAKQMGKRVVFIAPEGRIGGLTTSGLGATDHGDKDAIGGLSREFYQRIREYYFNIPSAWKQETLEEYQGHVYKTGINEDTMWFFEPHVAKKVFYQMLEESGIQVILTERLDLREGVGVQKKGTEIQRIRMESGREFKARMFIDATYEGDLMAKAGVSYIVGRESNDTYGETANGIQLFNEKYNLHMFARKVDPYVIPGDPKSGLIYGIQEPEPPGKTGEGDHRVQSYCFRLCMTDVEENQVLFPKPDNYDPARYELLLRYIQSDEKFPWVPQERFENIENMALGWDARAILMPNRKTDANTKGPISFNFVGGNYDYPDGNYTERERIVEAHKNWQQGLIWFMANDPRIPAKYSDPVNEWGLTKDEFVENDNWPPQLYIREARRMIGEYVVTEHNCKGDRVANNSIGMGSYTMDSHIVSRYVYTDGYVRNEGHVGRGSTTYPISYHSITPKKNEVTNLLVSAAVSASHVAFGSIRMEPVFMVLGQAAGAAAALSVEDGVPVQSLDYSKLRRKLTDYGQVVELPEE